MCPQGHEYESRIIHRTGGTGCPKCNPKTSRIEIRILTELRTIFQEVMHGRVFGKDYECDIFIPKYNLGIEVDGYWHKYREDRDSDKLDYFQRNKISLVRLRDGRLELNEDDIPFRENEKHIKVVKRLLENLVNRVKFSKSDQSKINQYLQESKIQNQREYLRKTRFIKTVLPEHSLEAYFPEIAKEWDYEKNYPLVPSSFAPFSHRKVSWICEKGHTWETSITIRADGSGCPIC